MSVATGGRAITSEDIQAVVDIYNYYVLNTVVSFEEAALSIDAMRRRTEDVQHLGYPWLVAEDRGRVIGYAYAGKWNARHAYRHTAEVTVYLDSGSAGKGWGTALYQALFALLKKRDIRTVVGGIALPNPASAALHEKMGMTKVAHFSKVGFKFGQWIDVGYWQGFL